MRNLIQLILKYNAFLLFLILEIISFTFIVERNRFQHNAVFHVTHTIASSFYNISNSILGYFNLKEINSSLSEENTQLKNQIVSLQNQQTSMDSTYIPADNNLEYIEAKVINNSISRPNNYMIINKGERDGLKTDMAVICSEGIVGIVSAVSNQFAIVETLLNNKAAVNARLTNSGEVGQLKWDGINYQYAYLEDIPRHVNVTEGDTVVTSGYSIVFPKDILIGTVEKATLTDTDATYNLKIRLSTNFKTIRYVQIINNKNTDEIEKLEESIQNM